MTDCLIIGFNDYNFELYTDMVGSMGLDSGAYRDLSLAFIEHEGRKYRSMDILNRFHFAGQPEPARPFHNSDFLWPVVIYLGTYLARRGFSWDYVNLFHLEKEKLKEKLLEGNIRTIAITTTLYVAPQPILEIVSFIREHNDSAKIVVGGPYVKNQTTIMDPASLEWLFQYIGADFYIISQEGEATLVNLLDALKHGLSLDGVNNLAYRSGDRYVVTAAAPETNDLTENMVDYGLFPRQDVGQLISVRTAKSCPFTCSFCGFPERAGKYTYLEVAMVERELDALRDLGVSTVTFLDDTFNVPKKRFREILRMMIEKQYGFRWNSFYRSDHGDPETIELMGRAGCEGVFLGIESGSDEMLKRMNKTSRRKNYLEAIPLLQAAGISCHASLIIGFPGETLDTVQETIGLIEETRPDYFRAQLWYADPVTPIWKQKDQYGVKGDAFSWSHDTMDYQMACDLVDEIFLSVKNSTWLPQYGFEQWSTFYLQRQGMSREQIKNFVRSFNAAVLEKLIHPHQREASPELIRDLKASSRFERVAS
jgi:radical SAM PhpK family P-methyltransferase